MKSYQEIYDFIKTNYKHSRFEGRNTKEWGQNYSHNIVQHHIEQLTNYGISHISKHECVNGKGIKFNAGLNIL